MPRIPLFGRRSARGIRRIKTKSKVFLSQIETITIEESPKRKK